MERKNISNSSSRSCKSRNNSCNNMMLISHKRNDRVAIYKTTTHFHSFFYVAWHSFQHTSNMKMYKLYGYCLFVRSFVWFGVIHCCLFSISFLLSIYLLLLCIFSIRKSDVHLQRRSLTKIKCICVDTFALNKTLEKRNASRCTFTHSPLSTLIYFSHFPCTPFECNLSLLLILPISLNFCTRICVSDVKRSPCLIEVV